MKKIIKKHYKVIMGLIIGLIISVPVVYAAQTMLSGNEVSYNNGTSGGSSNTVQGAIDELYDKVNKSKAPQANNKNILNVYYYNQDENSADFCMTGEEETCKVNTCYLNKTKDNCSAGTIVEYKVNDSDTVRFHVMFDEGNYMTLQSQKNIVYTTAWNSSGIMSEGPLTILDALEKKTNNWSNVRELTYKLGETNFSEKGYYTACNNHTRCESNSYTLDSKTSKSRIMTLQEAVALGCADYEKSCPIWMYNYLQNATDYGGNRFEWNAWGYWLINSADYAGFVYRIDTYGKVNPMPPDDNVAGARAVIEIDK